MSRVEELLREAEAEEAAGFPSSGCWSTLEWMNPRAGYLATRLAEVERERDQARAQYTDLMALKNQVDDEIERLRALKNQGDDAVEKMAMELERLRAGLREILAFDIEARFDAKASYTTRKAEEWRDLCGKARRLLGEEK